MGKVICTLGRLFINRHHQFFNKFITFGQFLFMNSFHKKYTYTTCLIENIRVRLVLVNLLCGTNYKSFATPPSSSRSAKVPSGRKCGN